ncbi:MAG TPA: RNA polymerase sigma factor [Syntrophomonadaceae bacterium]|nr:RNA polymerase sigma factor [Syntrophomonadaceae bacterium]
MIDVQLINQVKAGDLAAFEKLVETTSQTGLNIAYGILHDRSDAEEVLQEAFLAVYQNIQKLKSPEAFRTWFGTIVTHLAFRRSKLNGRFKQVPLDENIETKSIPLEGPDELILRKEEQELVFEALKTLPDEYRAALTLREWENYSYREISEVLGIPLGTVKSRIYTARAMLFKQLKKGNA